MDSLVKHSQLPFLSSLLSFFAVLPVPSFHLSFSSVAFFIRARERELGFVVCDLSKGGEDAMGTMAAAVVEATERESFRDAMVGMRRQQQWWCGCVALGKGLVFFFFFFFLSSPPKQAFSLDN
jgi:hypothetical protein